MSIRNTALSLGLAVFLFGCAGDLKGPVAQSQPILSLTYHADTHRTWAGCGSTTNSGHGTVKNVGGSDAIGCYVTIKTDCGDTYSVWVHPRDIAPGQFGEYQTGPFNGRQNKAKLTAGYKGK